ncbi:prepilin-type N-terminal cleavage/methylation domain-containing protein [Limnobacter humi]|uniref:Prepilin-type N-terminal cleavage/methylation domain-containing protein n=1 Tax=Limnobacter humi TaxID=1778671 RepID=A0ABT1WIV3_9BURK|nr:prepilin-type N-terminal cleavage/methylation domain-containing protein [Limnobacter humi]MCQ8897445.1 prepilin-type N-terminal cleavage/methylation domain-containing protein [Limnobacter humi]
MKHNTRPTSSAGFSLLELSIAMAVLAILAGGILKGRELIASAKVQSVITDLASLETAMVGFQSRYGALPGDFPAADAAGLGTTGGDGNGRIEGTEEEGHVFTQLQKAGFIQGDYSPPATADASCGPSSCMASRLGGVMVISSTLEGPSTPEGAAVVLFADQGPVRQLAEIDRKLDDGNPLKGSVQVLNADVAACTSNGFWNEKADVQCGALYVLR